MDETQVTRDTYEQIAGTYAERWATNDAVMAEARARFLTHLAPHPFVVDIGCGPGRDLCAFAQDGVEALGVDLSLAMLAEARKRFNGQLMVADMRSLPFGKDTLDGAWLCASLLHVPKRHTPATLSGLSAVLRSGGTLFVGVKEGQGESFRTRDGLERFFSFYSESEITSQVTEAGFEVLERWLDTDDVHPDPWINVIAKAS